MNEVFMHDLSFGFSNPQTVSTLEGMFTWSFEIVNLARLTAMAAPPPLLQRRWVLMYFIPFISSSSSILYWCFLFSSCSHISVTKQISAALSLIFVTREDIFGKSERALNCRIVGIDWAKDDQVLFLTGILTIGSLITLSFLGLRPMSIEKTRWGGTIIICMPGAPQMVQY